MAKSNLSQQQQSIETPFMTTPLVDIFGYLAKDGVAQSVINGTYQPLPNTPKFVKEFLKTLEMPEAIIELGPVDLKTSCEENRTGWGKMKHVRDWSHLHQVSDHAKLLVWTQT